MVDEKFRASLENYCDAEGISPLLFDNPSYDNSVVGVSGSHIVYDLEKMINEIQGDGIDSDEDAREFIEYNTLRALPYADKDTAPIVVDISKQELVELF